MASDSPLILVIEDEAPIRKFLRAALTGDGYRVVEAETGQAGILQATTNPADVVVLDLGLPDIDGLEVARQLRGWSLVPIIVLSARGQEHDKISALDAGADDYLTKPFSVGELLARIRVALRHGRGAAAADPIFTNGDLRIDLATRRVGLAEREIHVTPIEYRILAMLVKHAGKVVTHTQLLKEVWGPGAVHDTGYLRVFMASLRRKLETDPARPRYLLTEQGVGYRLSAGQ